MSGYIYKSQEDNMIKLIATDMDGTLLNSRGELSPNFYNVFKQLKEKNIIFAAASGRQYFTLVENFKAVSDDMLFIAENGTYIAYRGKEIAVHPLDRRVAHQLIEKGRTIEDVYIVLATSKGAYIENADEDFVREVNKYYVKCQLIDDLLSVEGDILKVTLCDFKGAEHNSYLAYEDLRSKAQMSVAGDIWLDMMANGVNKGKAIEDIQQQLGITYEETMVFGDYLNDFEMLQKAHHSYAMANAHPSLKKIARFSAKSNDEDGVIQKIKEVVLKQDDEY